MTDQHDEENPHRGGLREAVDDLFGRGGTDTRDQHDENARRDDAYADDTTLDREPGTTTEFGDTQSHYAGDPVTDDDQRQTTHGDEVRGDTVVPEQVQRGDDPTAQGQFQDGGEVRGDTDLPGESRYDDTVSGDVQHGDAAVAEPPSATSGQVSTGHVDDTTDPASARADVGQPTGEPVSTDTYSQAASTPEAPSTPAASSTTAATASPDTSTATTGAVDTKGAADTAAANAAAVNESDAEGHAALVTADRAESYSSRWNDVKGEFVDEPRRAVADADALVGELLDELQELFKAQRSDIEHSLDADETSTEDLRLALRRYRSFFDRLLSI
jgi:hypothetical protein